MAYKTLKHNFYCHFLPETCGYFNKELKVCETDSTIGICPFQAPLGFIENLLKQSPRHLYTCK